MAKLKSTSMLQNLRLLEDKYCEGKALKDEIKQLKRWSNQQRSDDNRDKFKAMAKLEQKNYID